MAEGNKLGVQEKAEWIQNEMPYISQEISEKWENLLKEKFKECLLEKIELINSSKSTDDAKNNSVKVLRDLYKDEIAVIDYPSEKPKRFGFGSLKSREEEVLKKWLDHGHISLKVDSSKMHKTMLRDLVKITEIQELFQETRLSVMGAINFKSQVQNKKLSDVQINNIYQNNKK